MFWSKKRCVDCDSTEEVKSRCESCADDIKKYWYHQGYQLGLQKEKDKKIPQSVLKQMLLLCHPDKHSNSPVSNEVTKWLLERRKK